MKILKVCLFVLCAGALLFAQGSGSLSGKITDSSGRAVPNAVIILTSESGGTSQRIVTSQDGTFSVANLEPGEYRVEVETGGARRPGRQTVLIRGDAPSQIEVSFDAGAAGVGGERGGMGMVEIRAIAPTVQIDSAEVARSYGTNTVRSLPMLDRQHQELIGLMPGVTPPTPTGDRIEDPQRQRQFNVNGQPDFANIHHQDGAYNNESYSDLVSRVQPNESVQALQVRTSNYNAEYGFSGGSWTNMVTRPGTKNVHGSLFGFNTNNYFTARNPFLPGDVGAPRFTQNQFGGTVGGPAIPDRMFWFLSYDGFLRRGRDLAFATVPTEAMRAGSFTAFPGLTLFNPATGSALTGAGRTPFAGNTISASQFNSAARALLGGLPLPNQSGLVNNFVGTPLLHEDNHRLDGKIDHRFSDQTHGFLRYGFTHADVERESILGPLGNAANAGLRNHNAVASVSHNMGATALGEFRFGYNRYRNQIVPMADTTGLSGELADLGFTGGIPQFNIAGFGAFGTPNYAPRSINNTYNGATNWMWHTGRHKLKFGADVRHILADGFATGAFSPFGTFVFGPGGTASTAGNLNQVNLAANAFASFLAGAPTQAGITNFIGEPGYRQTQYAGYVTDTLTLFQRLHLELGVRYDVYSPLRPRDEGGAGVFDPIANTFNPFESNGLDEFGNQRYDWNNIAPRVGFAIRPFERMAVRGGYGILFFPTPFALSGLNLLTSGVQQGIAGGFTTVPFRVPTVTPPGNGNAAGNQPFFLTNDDRVETPYVQSFNFTVQGDMGHGFLLDVGYVGTLGRQMPFSRALAARPGSGIAGLPFDGRTAATFERATGLNNNYHSGQVNLTKRFANSFGFSAAYTWSRAQDYGSSLLNPFDRQANYGPADWDRRHILSISHLWRLPGGASTGWQQILANWELNGILRWATGTPFTVTADPLFCACPGVQSVPANFIGSGEIEPGSTFDPSQFEAPGAGGFGNLGRNALRGPETFTYNLALFRGFNFAENMKLELRGEAYNLTNSTNFLNPVGTLGVAGAGRSLGTFGGIGGRQFQVAARVLF